MPGKENNVVDSLFSCPQQDKPMHMVMYTDIINQYVILNFSGSLNMQTSSLSHNSRVYILFKLGENVMDLHKNITPGNCYVSGIFTSSRHSNSIQPKNRFILIKTSYIFLNS